MLSKALLGDPGFDETFVILSASPRGLISDDPDATTLGERELLEATVRDNMSSGSRYKLVRNTGRWLDKESYAVLKGDVAVSRAQSLDVALWRVGGPSITLELIRSSTVSSSWVSDRD